MHVHGLDKNVCGYVHTRVHVFGNVFMYVAVSVWSRMRLYVDACIYKLRCVDTYAYVQSCPYMSLHVYMHVTLHMCICVYTRVCVCGQIYVNVWLCVQMYECVYTGVSTNVCVYVGLFVYICGYGCTHLGVLMCTPVGVHVYTDVAVLKSVQRVYVVVCAYMCCSVYTCDSCLRTLVCVKLDTCSY